MLTIINMSLFTLCLLILCALDITKAFLLPGRTTELCPDILPRDKYLHVLRDRCYEFVLYRSNYWSDARRDCTSRGGDLVVISDGDTQDFILGTLRELGNTHRGIWIGLSDKKKELHWEWVNGEPLGPYSHWAHGQGGPNALHFTQDCAQIRLNDHGLWHDRECHLWPNTAPYICQYDMKPVPSTSTMVTSTTTLPSTPDKTTGRSLLTTTLSKSTSFIPPLTTSPTTSTAPTLSESTTSTAKLSTLPINMVMNTSRATLGVNRSKSTTVTSSRSSLSSAFLTKPSVVVSTFVPNTKTNAVSSGSVSERIPTTKASPPTTSSSTSTVVCSDVDCARSCPNGYSGVFVGLDGCVTCMCT